MSTSVTLQNGIDLKELVTTGSTLHINEDYEEIDHDVETDKTIRKTFDIIGEPVKCFIQLEKQLSNVDYAGHVKKKVLEQGGGLPLNEGCTVSIAYSGYWENDMEPFDVRKLHKPLVVDLKDNGLLPGLQIAIKSMLVEELSLFMLSYHVMYGEMGISPRIKPRSNCVFYIKLIKSILTSKQGEICFSEPNMFQRVHHEVKLLYSSGIALHKTTNDPAAINMFRKAVFMLHKCRLANEQEEKVQEKLLIKLYINLAICYNKTKQPLKACIACNELNRLNSLWSNGKVLFQNAKALRMIGQFDTAEKRLKRAMNLCPDNEEMKTEELLLNRTRDSCNQTKLIGERTVRSSRELVSDEFKCEVDNLVKNFKENDNLCKLTLPAGLNRAEIEYIKETCVKENLFFNKIQKKFALDKDEDKGFQDFENQDEKEKIFESSDLLIDIE